MAWADFAGDCGAGWGDRRLDHSTALCVGYAEDDQERLHEHVSDQLYTQANRDDGDVQSVCWISEGGDERRGVILNRSS